MDCIHCGAAGFNRAIVNLDQGEGIDGICKECEETVFGQVLESGFWQREDNCLFCADEASFAFPILECHIERDHADDIIEYQIDENTPLLCSTHARKIHPDLTFERAPQIKTV